MFDLRNSGLAYKVGDALGMFPENSPIVVQHLLEALHASGAEDVLGRDGHWVSLRQALLHELTVTKPSDDLLALLAKIATDPNEKQELEKFAVEGLNDDDHRHVLDLLHDYPSARPTPEAFAAALSAAAAPALLDQQRRCWPTPIRSTSPSAWSAGRTCKGRQRRRRGQHVHVRPHPPRPARPRVRPLQPQVRPS